MPCQRQNRYLRGGDGACQVKDEQAGESSVDTAGAYSRDALTLGWSDSPGFEDALDGTDDLRVEPCTIDNLESIVALTKACLPMFFTVEFLEVEFRKPLSRFYGAFNREGDLVGVVFGSIEKPFPNPPCLMKSGLRPDTMFLIKVLAVDKEYRRRNIGRRLMETIIFQLTNSQYKETSSAYLQVMTENIGAIALYEELGFVVATLIPQYYSTTPRRDAFLMVKILQTRGSQKTDAGQKNTQEATAAPLDYPDLWRHRY